MERRVLKSFSFEGIEQKKEFLIHVRINENGFRDGSYDEDEIESGSAFRILGVGDSFTYGYGVEENDSGLVLVFIPHRSQVHPGLAVDAHIVSGYFNDWDRRIENYSRKHDILFINLLPYLVERAQRGETLYFLETDAHWNPNGHEVAARVICDFLTQEFFVKEDK